MIRHKGELSPAGIDRGRPHQVALRAIACEGGGYKAIHDFCKDLSLCPRGHSVIYEGAWFHVYCFAEANDAEFRWAVRRREIRSETTRGRKQLGALEQIAHASYITVMCGRVR